MPDALRLAIVATHPVQYNAPLYRRLANEPGVDLTVFFAHRPSAADQGAGFGVAFEWDVDVTGGFRHEWLPNIAAKPSASTFDGCDTPAVATALERGRFDAALLMGWHSKTYWQALRGCWRGGVPAMVRGDSQLDNDRGAKRAIKRAVYPLFMRRFSACLSVGTRSEAYFRHYGARRVVRAPHFVDNAFFARAATELAPQRDAIRAEWGIPADATVFLFAGKLIPKKRPLDLVRAAARLGRPGAFLLFAGDGELRGAVRQAVAEAGIAAAFTGFLNQTQLPRAYVASDAIVLPSDARETWGLVINEAMASGLPAIVSDAAGCSPDLVVGGRTGYVFPLGDVDALADRMATLASDRERLHAAGRAAREHVERFDVAAAAAGVLEGARLSLAPGRAA